MESGKHALILFHLCALNSREAIQLVNQHGSYENALSLFKNWGDSWKRDWELVEKEGVHVLSFFDESYPASFKKLADPPFILYVKGKLQSVDSDGIAIVGTRLCSNYGKEMAEKLAKELAAQNVSVISGLARGIDTAAHRGALEKGRTIAIIGSGLSNIYPRENISLSKDISESGAIISEYPMMTTPQKHHFPKRNRLVSSLSKGVLLVEAPLKSGAMITMEIAKAQEKFCFALPGPADRESFQGNHFLIKTGKAQLVENSQDMLSILNPELGFVTFNLEKGSELDPEEELLVKALSKEELSLDELTLRVNFPIAKLNSLLMGLVLKQKVREYPGKFYKIR